MCRDCEKKKRKGVRRKPMFAHRHISHEFSRHDQSIPHFFPPSIYSFFLPICSFFLFAEPSILVFILKRCCFPAPATCSRPLVPGTVPVEKTRFPTEITPAKGSQDIVYPATYDMWVIDHVTAKVPWSISELFLWFE